MRSVLCFLAGNPLQPPAVSHWLLALVGTLHPGQGRYLALTNLNAHSQLQLGILTVCKEKTAFINTLQHLSGFTYRRESGHPKSRTLLLYPYNIIQFSYNEPESIDQLRHFISLDHYRGHQELHQQGAGSTHKPDRYVCALVGRSLRIIYKDHTAIVSITALNYIIIGTTCTFKPNRKPNHNPYDDALHILHNYPRGCEHLIPHMYVDCRTDTEVEKKQRYANSPVGISRVRTRKRM